MNRIGRALLAKWAGQGSERGATASEYGLLVGFIAFVIVAGVGFFGQELDAVFQGFATFVDTTF